MPLTSALTRDHLAALVEHMPVAISVYRLDDLADPRSLRLVYGNARSEEITGLRASEEVGRRIVDIAPNVAETGMLELYAEVARGGDELDLGAIEYGDDRIARRTFHVKALPLPDQCVAVEFRDVSEKQELHELRQVQHALEGSEERLRLATHSAALGTWDYDLVSDELNWDARCKAIFGLAPNDPIDFDVFVSLVHPDDRAETLRQVEGALDPSGEGRYDIEYRVVWPDQTTHWVHATGKGLFEDVDGARKAVRFIGTARDITEAKHAAAELAASEERYRFLGQTLEQQLWTSHPDGKLDYVNRFTCDYFGRSEAEMIGEGWQHVIHEEDLPLIVERWTRALETGEPYEVEFRLRRAQDQEYRWHIGRAHALRDDEGHIVKWFGANTDIHERKKAEETLLAVRRELEATNQSLEARVAERTARLEAFAEDLKLLHRITTANHTSRNALVDAYLEAGCAMFNMPVGVLGRVSVQDGTALFIPEAIIGDEIHLQVDVPAELSQLFAKDVVQREETVAIVDASDQEAWSTHQAFLERGHRSFLGTPIWVDDHLYGTVHFLSPEPQESGFEAFEQQIVEVLAEMIGRALSLERAQRERETQDLLYRSIVETVSEALLLVNWDGAILMSNPAAEELLGIDSEDRYSRLSGEHRWEIFDEEGMPIKDDELPERRVLRDGTPVQGEIQGVRSEDGSISWLSVNARALDRDADGKQDAVVISFNDITTLRNANETLEEQTLQLKEAQQLAKLGYWHFDLASGHVHWSDELYDIFGVDRSMGEVNYEKYAERLHPEDRPDVEAAVQKAIETGEPYELSHRVVQPNGSVRWIHSHGEALLDAEGNPLRLQGTAQDVTERVEAQRAIEGLTKRLERILEAAGEGIYGLDLEGRTTFVNAAAAAMLGYTRDELIGQNQHEVLHHSHPDGSPYDQKACPIYAVLQDGQERRVDDEVFWRNDGSSFPVEYVSSPIEDEGTVVGAVVVFQNVSERRKAEEAVRASEMRLRTLTDAAAEAIVTANEDGRIVDWNKGAETIFGHAKEDIVGQLLERIMPERYRDAHRQGMKRYLATGAERVIGQSVELVGLRQDGSTFPLDLSLTTWTMDGATYFTAIIRDITERKEAQRRLEEYAAEIEAARQRLQSYTDELEERNEELQQFAYVASHDLQEPLRMVTSFLQLLERRYGEVLDDTATQYIDFAVDGARRMQALIKDLLAYSRVGTHGRDFEAVEGDALLETVLRDLGPALSEVDGEIEADALPSIHGDPTQLHQLFLNLISNAIKFRRPGTTPSIRISASPAMLAKGRPGWQFQIADNGIGIEQQYADRIFQVFQRLHTRDEYEGTGIGLAICKKIVERHGGDIGFEPTPGGGTTFIFTLPSEPPLTHSIT